MVSFTILQNIIPHSMMFQMLSLGLRSSSIEIQKISLGSFLELRLPEIVEARNENDGYCHNEIWAIRQDWEEIESELEINTGQ
jgi:hypothetical protein